MKDIECKHVSMKKHQAEDVYIYRLKDQDIVLCTTCHMILAGEIMKQLATEVFVKDFYNDFNVIKGVEKCPKKKKKQTKKTNLKKKKK